MGVVRQRQNLMVRQDILNLNGGALLNGLPAGLLPTGIGIPYEKAGQELLGAKIFERMVVLEVLAVGPAADLLDNINVFKVIASKRTKGKPS